MGNIVKKIIFSVMAVISLVACQGYSSTGGPGVNFAPSLKSGSHDINKLRKVNSLLVLPVEMDRTVASNIPSNLDIDSMLNKALNDEIQIKIEHYSLNKPSSAVKPQMEDYLARARAQKIDAVLHTRINSFSVRRGSALGSTDPAKVDLVMQILKSEKGEVLWNSSYHYKDQALSDNLFKIKDKLAERSAKFRSADELIDEGFRSALRDFSEKRLQSFTR